MPILDRIQHYNAGRDPERLQMKLAAMCKDPFVFLRGTCHLFYEDWHPALAKLKSPAAWICGDLHLENFGSYKAENGLAYFDLNDFDEAALAPCLWELTRLLTSLLVAQDTLKLKPKQTTALLDIIVQNYAQALAEGKPKWVERKTARGSIRHLLSDLSKRSNQAFIASRTNAKAPDTLLIDGKRALALDKVQKQAALEKYMKAMQVQDKKEFFYPLDIARRIAGTGSLGLERYVVLVNGKGPERRALIDMKASNQSALSPYLNTAAIKLTQPDWMLESQRVATIQAGAQILPPALLKAVCVDKQSYLIKALQPSQDRVDLTQWDGKLSVLDNIFASMASLTAWAHLRNAGYLGAANREALMAFGAQVADWRGPVLTLAKQVADHTIHQWQDYVSAYQAAFKKPS
ncbi:DUF2252 family protein [Methylophilus sp. 13]|uniref:DUF2252 family protein n=1 Tax=Methylophilus sp. 13 TaxID=2781018 RepID=UPI00188F4AA1|nr:DUF2252 family protein [Methylophilus sp. 13]MBF5039850.1 DUF2252 family protein [Methylophilus sp. 13]